MMKASFLNRWWIAASAVAIHMSIGSVYAYSAWKMPLENTFGWSATHTTMAFSTAIFFLGITFVILTCYGGGFSCIPAYISDVFGLNAMPTIHGMLLTAWSLAGIAGPLLNSAVYERTHDYRLSLYIFGGAFGVALLISLLMKVEIHRMARRHELSVRNAPLPEPV